VRAWQPAFSRAAISRARAVYTAARSHVGGSNAVVGRIIAEISTTPPMLSSEAIEQACRSAGARPGLAIQFLLARSIHLVNPER